MTYARMAARRFGAVLLSLFLVLPSAAQVVVRPGPVAVGPAAAAAAAPVSPLVPAWTATFQSFLTSPDPDPAQVRAVARDLARLNLNDPAVRAQLAPLAAALSRHAAPLLVTPGKRTTNAQLEDADAKLEILNYPAVRALLPEEQQSQVGAASWAYNKSLWQPSADEWIRRKQPLRKTLEDIAAALERPAADLTDTPAPAPGPGPQVSVEVLTGDISKVRADAVLTTVQDKHLCGGGVNAIVGAANPCFFAQLQKAPELEDGRSLLARGDGKGPIDNVLFIKDRYEKPLADIVYEGLRQADREGLKSVAVPAMRSGSVFGAVERSYREIALELRKGVERFLAEARATLSNISFVVYNDDKLAEGIQNAFGERAERERSLRTDLREAKLSARAYELTPKTRPVDDRRSPIYASLLKPWSLKHLLVAHRPVKIGVIEKKEAFSRPVTSVLNMPIKLIGGKVRVPVELEQFREFLQKVVDHERSVNPAFDDFYMYLTVDQHEVKKGRTHRRPGVHIDGVQGARYKRKLPPEHLYSASDALGTVFYDQSFDLTALDPAKHHVHAELERQADEKNARATPDYDIAFWDSYSVHRADLAKADMLRTFVRVEFSQKKYDSEGDTVNPALDYQWERIARPIPAELDDRPLSGYDPELAALRPGQPHTVKNLPKWIADNIGADALKNDRRFVIVEGDTKEVRLKLEAQGWRVREAYAKETGFHLVQDATTPQGERVNLVLGVNGRSRVIHIQSFLKLAGVRAERVSTRRGFRSWKPEYRAEFERIGHVPDLVVFGLTRPAIRALIGDEPGLEAFWKEFNGKGAPFDNDISRRPMKVVELADGRRVWFFLPLFGELAGDLMEALLEHGARKVAVLSSAGALKPDAKLGDWFDPREGGHHSMPTSNTQTQDWVRKMSARGVSTVDMEYESIVNAFARHPEAELIMRYVISDVMTGPARTDLTEVRIGTLPGLTRFAVMTIAKALGLRPDELSAVRAENRSFPAAL